MKIGVVKERRPNEKRCAVSPDTIKKFVGLGAEVLVEAGAGEGCSIPDSVYQAAGATIVPDARAALGDADIVLKVQRPLTAAEGGPDELSLMKRGAMLVAILDPYGAKDQIGGYAQAGVIAFAMELMPRITPRPDHGRAVARRRTSPATRRCSTRRPSSAAPSR